MTSGGWKIGENKEEESYFIIAVNGCLQAQLPLLAPLTTRRLTFVRRELPDQSQDVRGNLQGGVVLRPTVLAY
ncbi:hypothetical protein L484_013136 [Morus notabilis]|uniref:Uncharacterized protein n=1 Tax=Morus notabilis TaxID=981085 RepID=W9RJV7_9ROSA|nr:hypothetical protein L484_013136 [Morus notabilis]